MKYKDRYVLATGYPWGLGPESNITGVEMDKGRTRGGRLKIKWPPELWATDLPPYRLVLERVKRGGGK